MRFFNQTTAKKIADNAHRIFAVSAMPIMIGAAVKVEMDCVKEAERLEKAYPNANVEYNHRCRGSMMCYSTISVQDKDTGETIAKYP